MVVSRKVRSSDCASLCSSRPSGVCIVSCGASSTGPSCHPGVLEALVGLITDEFSLSDSNPYTVCGVRGGEKEPGAEPPTQPLMYRFDFTAEL